MKAFVTGGTGFIGGQLTRILIEDGYRVAVLARKESDRRNLAGLDVEIIEGDIRDYESLKTAMSGCDTLFHTAADYRLWTRNPQEMYDVNVRGTRNVLQAAYDAGISRVVYTSSVGTLGNPGDGSPGCETTPVDFADMVGHYKKSKFLAEREAESFIRYGLPLVIVNPSTPVGPGDIRPTPTGKIIVDFLRRRMPAYIETGLNIIDVTDCARGHILAAEKGKVGEKYILGNENLSLRQILEILADITGLPAPRVRLPYFPLLVAACLNEGFSRITGREPRIPLTGVRMARNVMFFDASKAVRELGLPRRPAQDSFARAVDWFRANRLAS